jgi:hypothetical protein
MRRYSIYLLFLFCILCVCLAREYVKIMPAKIWKMSDNDIYSVLSNKITVGTSEAVVIKHLGEPMMNKAVSGHDLTYFYYSNPYAKPILSKTSIQSISLYIKNHQVVSWKVQKVISSEMSNVEIIKPQAATNNASANGNVIFIYTLFTNSIDNGKSISNAAVQGWISNAPDITLTKITSLRTANITERAGFDVTAKEMGLLIGLSENDKKAFDKYTRLFNGYEAVLLNGDEYITRFKVFAVGETDTLQLILKETDVQKAVNAFSSLIR